MRFLIVLPMVLFSMAVNSKTVLERVDSVYQECLDHPKDVDRLYNLNGGLNNIYSSYSDTAAFYAQEQVRLAKDVSDTILIARGYNMWGICVEFQGDLDSAIGLYQQALFWANLIDQPKLTIDIYTNLGIVFSYKGLYQSSLDYTLKSLEIAEAQNDSLSLSLIYNNLGLRYSELGNETQAIHYYRKSIEYKLSIGSEIKAGSTYSNLGRSFFIMDRIDSSIVYYHKALALHKKAGSLYNQCLDFAGLSMAYLKQSDFNWAKLYRDSAYARAIEIDDDYGIHEAKMISGRILFEQDQYEAALPYYLESIQWLERNKYRSSLLDLYHEISRIYAERDDFELAHHYMKKFAFLKDSIYSDQKDLAMEEVSLYKESKALQERNLLNTELALRSKSLDHQKDLKNVFVILGLVLFLLAIGLIHRIIFLRKTRKALRQKNEIIQKEKDRSEELLLNILPGEVAEELKEKGESQARNFDLVSILFTDFKDFTRTSAQMSASELVEKINFCFRGFDEIMEKYGIEKIKTIGDSYMAASGLPLPSDSSVSQIVLAALEMQAFISQRKAEMEKVDEPAFEMRVGIHTGSVVAGIVGVKKFQYDIWGDTVNTASRMESNGVVGKVNISESTYEIIKEDPRFKFQDRGTIEVKGKGKMQMYFVNRSDN